MVSPLKMHHFLVPPCPLFFWQNSYSWWTQTFVPFTPALIWLNFAGKSPGQIDDSIKWKWSTSWIFSQHGPEILWCCFLGKLTSSNDSSLNSVHPLFISFSLSVGDLQVSSVLHLICLLFPSLTIRLFLVQIIHISQLNHCYIVRPCDPVFILWPSNPFSIQQKLTLPYLKCFSEFHCT